MKTEEAEVAALETQIAEEDDQAIHNHSSTAAPVTRNHAGSGILGAAPGGTTMTAVGMNSRVHSSIS